MDCHSANDNKMTVFKPQPGRKASHGTCTTECCTLCLLVSVSVVFPSFRGIHYPDSVWQTQFLLVWQAHLEPAFRPSKSGWA